MDKAQLSPAKRALLEQWLQGQSPTNGNGSTIPRRTPNSKLCLSLPQQRHLFLDLLDRGTAVNHLSVFLQLNGKLSKEALEQSANAILARHEVLRTRFCFGSGLPIPEIVDDCQLSISWTAIETSETGSEWTEAQQMAGKEILLPFDLTMAPLIRLRIYQLSPQKSALLLVVHHAIADGWSLGIFLQELMLFYNAHVSGKPAQAPLLPIQYYDYARWQREPYNQHERAASLSYWKQQLGGELPLLALPMRQVPAAKHNSMRGQTLRFVISPQQTQALEAMSREEDATLFMTLLTAFYGVLHRYSGQDDILVGTPIANRLLPELEPLIGIFINTLVLRVQVTGNPSFRELLRQVRQVCLQAYAHQDIPFEELVEALKPKRDLRRPPLFQVVFNLQNAPMPTVNMEGLETAFLPLDRGVSQFDISLMMTKVAGQCEAIVEYNPDLLDTTTITAMFGSYVAMLDFFITRRDASISQFQLVSPANVIMMWWKK